MVNDCLRYQLFSLFERKKIAKKKQTNLGSWIACADFALSAHKILLRAKFCGFTCKNLTRYKRIFASAGKNSFEISAIFTSKSFRVCAALLRERSCSSLRYRNGLTGKYALYRTRRQANITLSEYHCAIAQYHLLSSKYHCVFPFEEIR